MKTMVSLKTMNDLRFLLEIVGTDEQGTQPVRSNRDQRYSRVCAFRIPKLQAAVR